MSDCHWTPSKCASKHKDISSATLSTAPYKRFAKREYSLYGKVCCPNGIQTETVAFSPIYMYKKGACPAVTTGVIENAVVFSANGMLHSIFCEPGEVPTFAKLCALNGASAVFSGFAITPSEVIKCRLQTCLDYGEGSHISSVVSELVRRDGFRGFFRGLGATWLRDIPFYMVFFGSYSY